MVVQAKTIDKVAARPFLKWAGGKGRLMPQYNAYFPENFTTYYEPFLGGGAVFFYLTHNYPSFSAVLTDINSELINAYSCLQSCPEKVIALLLEHQKKHKQYRDNYYYKVRSYHPKNNWQRAARIIYLNKTCYNGLYRENAKGEFNVPIGRYKNPQICNQDLLYAVSTALQNAEIEVRPFEAVVQEAKSCKDFVYFDPPYYPISSTSNFTGYSRHAFAENEQVKLKNIFVQLAERGVKVMLSNSDCHFIREIYGDFNIHSILASRAINSNAKKRGKIPEVLITSY